MLYACQTTEFRKMRLKPAEIFLKNTGQQSRDPHRLGAYLILRFRYGHVDPCRSGCIGGSGLPRCRLALWRETLDCTISMTYGSTNRHGFST